MKRAFGIATALDLALASGAAAAQQSQTAFAGGEDRTCNNWRSSDSGQAMVGHHDRIGLRDDEASRSWNASHPSRGCSLDALKASGGAGLLYCFAAN